MLINVRKWWENNFKKRLKRDKNVRQIRRNEDVYEWLTKIRGKLNRSPQSHLGRMHRIGAHLMTLSVPNPQFQGHPTDRRQISRKHDIAQVCQRQLSFLVLMCISWRCTGVEPQCTGHHLSKDDCLEAIWGGQKLRTVLCCIVHVSCAQWYAHTESTVFTLVWLMF